MKAVRIHEFGGPEVLMYEDVTDPRPRPDQVLVRVKACSLNHLDVWVRKGLPGVKLPHILGSDVAGEVAEVGEYVGTFKTGQRVLVAPMHFCGHCEKCLAGVQNQCREFTVLGNAVDGGNCDLIAVPLANVIAIPDALDFNQAASVPLVFVTAWHMLVGLAGLRMGQTVLVLGASSGVGIAAIQIAKTRGCQILGVASASKHDFLRAQGCQHPIDSAGDYAAQARAVVGDKGVDLILDAVGGRSWTQGYDLLGPCGRLVAFGLSSASAGNTRNLLHALRQLMSVKKWNPMKLMDDNKTISGTNVGHLFSRPDLVAPQLASLMDMYGKGDLHPHVDRAFPFTEAAAAHQYIHDRKSRGKVLLVP